ncbi:fused (3R)-hydroxyacyl-ACP dehydratase subunits HadA/HadB [Nocardia sp. NPDC049190]|uniref:fused (3R)-hydroxyacyl-ACP dehydratase subunits HadA/HadB n=1 Tax=Nocardia sp. NPDC049190 TaxID=3155650 RepID=UPI00340DAB76
MSSIRSTSSETEVIGPAADASSMVGRRYRTCDYYEVGREKIREYARAVRNYHPVHWSEDDAARFGYDNLLAPLTFGSVPGGLAYADAFDTILPGYSMGRMIQTDQMIEFHRPLLAGDRLSFEMCLESFRRAFGGDLITLRQTIVDQHDRPLLTSRTSLVGRADGALPGSLDAVVMHGARPDVRQAHRPPPQYVGDDASQPTRSVRSVPVSAHALPFDAVTVGDELPPRDLTLSLGDLVNYAGVAGDPNPIHWSTEIAAEMELDTVVAQGMLTIGLSVDMLTSWLGDPGAVRAYNVRLTSPVHVTATGGRIEFRGRVKDLDPRTRTATVAITAEHHGRRVFGRATAEVALA